MLLYKDAKIIYPDKIRSGNVVVDNGIIIDICERFDSENMQIIDCRGLFLSPGFIDLHAHGGGGYSAMCGNADAVVKMCEAHAYSGTTSIVPTTLAAPVEKILAAMDAIAAAKKQTGNSNILGIHLEGPYLSYEMRGAQSPDDLLTPEEYAPENLLDYSDHILMMGAAPELPGGLALGKEITKRGIRASIAHSNARYELVEQAAAYGYSDVTHLYSACSTITRENLLRVGGVVEAGLALDTLTTQFIADLRHLPAGLLSLIYKCKGADNAYAISDALEFAALDIEEGKVYTQENGMAVVYDDNVMKLADYSSLAGSVATSAALVRNMHREAGIPLVDAVKMASLTPARVAGADRRKGKIQAGHDADILLFDEDIRIKLVSVNGKIIRNEL